jgi:maleylpyruvate isomerase
MDDVLRGDIDGLRAAQRTLVARLEGLTDDQARAASRLPRWSVGHVLTHLARNGDSVTRRLEGAARGEVTDQYPGGRAGRAADIEAGAQRAAAALLDDLVASHRRLDGAIDAMTDATWNGATRDVDGELQPAHDLIVRRWREVEVHHVDLGLGYEPSDWPAAFVERTLPVALADVGRRLPGIVGVDPATVVAWTYGRAAPPAGLPELLPF